jgi:RHS repeat-associated protein
VVALTDERDRVVQEYDYDSFGNLHDQSSKIKQPFAYTSRELDRETGLYYYRARYFDPMTGRFTSEDPIGFNGGVNFYSYVNNNVVNGTDPLGLFEYYGNWCGPDWTGGREEQFTLGHTYENPVDSLDSCCKSHDICYFECRENDPCDLLERGLCMTRCDRRLATCASSAGHKFSSPLWWWMNYNSAPSQGQNDPSCSAK